MTKDEKIKTIQQLGEYCTSTICHKDCPIYDSKWHNECHNSCMECLRFPDIAEQMADKINRIKTHVYE